MEEREQIELNLRLPAASLESFSRLTEQLRALAEAVNGGVRPAASAAGEERASSDAFDWARFQALSEGPEPPAAVQSRLSRQDGADAVRADVQRTPRQPESAGSSAMDAPSPAPEQAGRELADAQVLPVPGEAAPQPAAEEGEAPAVRDTADKPLADAPAVRADLEGQLPPAETVPAETSAKAEAAEVQLEMAGGADTPPAAGFSVDSVVEDAPGRWSSVTEELVTSGPAPLTAEAVSQAFQRDGRRYDNGFPLY